MNNKKFIITNDQKAADELIAKGFIMLSLSGGVYTFINSGELKFSKDTEQKITYTNSLFF